MNGYTTETDGDVTCAWTNSNMVKCCTVETDGDVAYTHMDRDLLQYLVGLVEGECLAIPDTTVHTRLGGNGSLRFGEVGH